MTIPIRSIFGKINIVIKYLWKSSSKRVSKMVCFASVRFVRKKKLRYCHAQYNKNLGLIIYHSRSRILEVKLA